MVAIIGAIFSFVVMMVTVLAVLGLPLGKLVMGGKHKFLSPKFKIIAMILLGIQIFATIILLQLGGLIGLWFSLDTTISIGFFFAPYFSLTMLINIISQSKKEKYIMTPLSLVMAGCYWLTTLGAQLLSNTTY